MSFTAGAQTWNALSTGMDKGVNCVLEWNGSLYAGGYFTTAGGGAASGVAKWNGSSWTPLGTGLTGGGNFNNVAAMAVYNNELYVGGIFTMAGGNSANYVAKWNGSTWSAVGTGTDNWVYAMQVFNGELYVGGSFNAAGGNNAAKVAKWNGSTWAPVFAGFTGEVRCFAIHNNELYAGGTFNNVSKLTSSGWSIVANFNNYISAIASDATNNVLYVGGGFTGRTYMYKNSTWSLMGTGITGSSTVWGMAMHNNKLYVAGGFTAAGGVTASNIASWDGSVWAAVGTGCNGQTQALLSYSGNLYVGGMFTTSGGVTTNNIAIWGTPTLSVDDHGNIADALNVYPNPFSESATISAGNSDFDHAEFSLYDVNGREVRKESDITGSFYRLEREGLNAGIYFYQFKYGDKASTSGRVIVQ